MSSVYTHTPTPRAHAFAIGPGPQEAQSERDPAPDTIWSDAALLERLAPRLTRDFELEGFDLDFDLDLDPDAPGEGDAEADGPCPWLDRTSLATAFDRAAFAALDAELLHDPARAFADVCWAAAVRESASYAYEARGGADSEHASDVSVPRDPPRAAPPAARPFADKLNTAPRRASAPQIGTLYLHHKAPECLCSPFAAPASAPALPSFSTRAADIGSFPTRPHRTRAAPVRRFLTFAYFHRPLSLSARAPRA
ncbi:hypothetical protein B0H15DRAFT_241873 [Mycena belliarum]|uniref:Uncharacterized protein n=1 Tax=Mycena belliarum TaxID=1033014 RepID=A0AAD6U776_9AGAR|nr:hypothetical protein B0H15DRAFT_241873 [Mycena belliae]